MFHLKTNERATTRLSINGYNEIFYEQKENTLFVYDTDCGFKASTKAAVGFMLKEQQSTRKAYVNYWTPFARKRLTLRVEVYQGKRQRLKEKFLLIRKNRGMTVAITTALF